MTPGSLPDPVAVAALVTRALDEAAVPYVIGGSFASSLHGERGSTNDIDLVADLDETRSTAFTRALGPAFYLDEGAARAAVRDGTSFNIIHVATAVKIDVFIAGADPLDRERLRRRLSATIDAPGGETRFYVDTPEDVILRKLEWYLPAARGGEVSERQWRDVLAVFRVQRHLDAEYLRRWGARLDVSDPLDRASTEARSS